MSPPLVTIMIPTFNQAQFVLQAIESALAQTYPSLEVIVGDDASSDATQQIVNDFITQHPDPRLRFLRNPANLGRVGNYRNLLYGHARGDYVLNLDGDDYLTEPHFISMAIRLIQQSQPTPLSPNLHPVMVVARATTFTLQEPVTSRLPSHKFCSGLQIVSRLPRAPYMFMHMAVLYHRQSALQADFYRTDALSADWESLYRLALRGQVAYLNQNIGVWRQHAGNQTTTRDAKVHLSNLRIWQPIYAQAQASGMSAWRAQFTAAICVAHFASASAIAISHSGVLPLLEFIARVAREFKLATLFMGLYPRYAARILLGLLGFYGRNSLRHR